ncbi:hypothetical protein BX600DRAFT_284163 [Xylariales sp. PMI_506]|nr:hypothetical protein BX600DRAFT_284163 [Xylariales sp. PMI_506]
MVWPFTESYPERKAREVQGKSYDYIVVGGGTAGCAVASRLSEDPDASVLVLERGVVGDNWFSRIPLLSGALNGLIPIVRRVSEPIKECDGRQTELWTGEALGGATRVNQMLYTRGVPGVYNEWAEMGHPGWSWDHVEPYFKRVENFVSHPGAKHLGRGGPVHVVQRKPQFEFYNHVDKAAAASGLPIQPDANDPSGPPAGYFYLDYSIDENSHRHSAYRAYLPKQVAVDRQSRLTICTGVIATKLELDAGKGLVTGVHIKPVGAPDQESYYVQARREVIVCSGAACSPQILMLSGIGPGEHLRSLGISVRKDLPGVGAHLSDHHGLPIMLKVPMFESLHRMESNPFFAVRQLLKFIWSGTGLMSSPTTSSAIYYNTARIDPQTAGLVAPRTDFDTDALRSENIPDVEIMVIPAGTIIAKHPGIPLFSLYTCLIRPDTVGRIELASLRPEDNPRIHYNMMEHPADVQKARKALRFTLNLAHNFIEKSGYPHSAELFYGPGAGTGRSWRDLSDEELESFARGSAQSVVHLGCSCRMAREEDGGVVDDELRVYGFRNLRVADASVFPKIPAAHTMAPTYMVAERCAQFVKDTWKSQA